jgi:hypothetical protein
MAEMKDPSAATAGTAPNKAVAEAVSSAAAKADTVVKEGVTAMSNLSAAAATATAAPATDTSVLAAPVPEPKVCSQGCAKARGL